MNPHDFATDFFESNRTTSAWVRDAELERARRKEPPVNLSLIPREQWDNYIDGPVALPEAVAKYINGRPETPFTVDEIDNLEEAIEKAYGVTAPYSISISPKMARLGRTWAYIADAAPYLSGFLLSKEESMADLTKRMG